MFSFVSRFVNVNEADIIICVAQSGSIAMRDLVSNLPCGQQRPAKNLEGDTVVAILNTILEIISENLENARFLIQGQGIQKLVSINKTR